MENADKTHFLVNVDNARSLSFCSNSNVEYDNVISGEERLTMLVRILSGRDLRIDAPFLDT